MKKLRGIEHEKLQSIASNYNYCLKRINQIKLQKVISKSEKEILSAYEAYVFNVQRCFKDINLLERNIIEKEYFTPLPPNWWINVYSRATYYRLRLSASKKFLSSYEAK